MDEELVRYDALGQAELVHRRELKPRELVEASLGRIEELDPLLHAVIHLDADAALEAADSVDPDLPFAGVPILVKDLAAEVEGMPLHEGSAYLEGYVSDHDQEYVARLRRAGFVILGKTNTPEFGMLPTAESARHGATGNPWDPTRTAGGSSGGSAAAVASGMVPVAHGNDLGGSIRIPASACGLFGLKPTRARNPLGPRYGDVLMGWAVEHVLTRTVRDSAGLLDVTSGADVGDPYPAPAHAGIWLDEIQRSPGRLRIGVGRRDDRGQVLDPTARAALDDAIGLLLSLGHEVVERELPTLSPAEGAEIGLMYGALTEWIVRYWAEELGREPEPEELEPLTRWYWRRGRAVSGGEVLMAHMHLQQYSRRVAASFDDPAAGFDLWLTPTVGGPTPRLGELLTTPEHDGTAASSRWISVPLVIANLTGRAAMSVPLWTDEQGLPLGMHLLGSFGGESMLLRLAAQLEQARPWHRVWPPVSAPCLAHVRPMTH
jgi:amidase